MDSPTDSSQVAATFLLEYVMFAILSTLRFIRSSESFGGMATTALGQLLNSIDDFPPLRKYGTIRQVGVGARWHSCP